LLAKFSSLAGLTAAQSLLLYGVMQLCTGGIAGAVEWQIPAIVLAAIAAVAIGLAISAFSKSVLQAVMIVPLVLIPQILFSGFIPPAGEMAPGPQLVSRLMPSAAVQGVIDTSLFWNKTIAARCASTILRLSRTLIGTGL
jgi:predicted cobalt transporter CbtA